QSRTHGSGFELMSLFSPKEIDKEGRKPGKDNLERAAGFILVYPAVQSAQDLKSNKRLTIVRSMIELALILVAFTGGSLVAQAPTGQKDAARQRTEKLIKGAEYVELADLPEERVQALLAALAQGDKRTALRKEQYQAARVEVMRRWANVLAGRGSLDLTLGAFQRLLLAELDLSDRPADHLAALEGQLQRTRDVEAIYQARFAEGRLFI